MALHWDIWTQEYFGTLTFQPLCRNVQNIPLGAVHKLRLQEEGGSGKKNQFFVNFYTIENVNRGGVGGQKKPNIVNVVCELPPTVTST